MDEFFSTIMTARNQVMYAGAKNSLVEWTLSLEWEQPDWLHKYPKMGICKGTYNGQRTKISGKTETRNSFAGEIG